MAGDQMRARAWAAAVAAARRRAGVALPDGLTAAADRLRRKLSEWAVAEVAPGRLVPWLPVAFGFGIVGYFTADREPAWWSAAGLTVTGTMIAVATRRRPLGFAMALAFAAMAAGFAVATLKTVRITPASSKSARSANAATASSFVCTA